MAIEAAEAPRRVAAMLAANRAQAERLGERIRRLRPRMIVTCARGSSDHAAACLRFAFQQLLGVPAFDLSPGLASVYDMALDLEGAICILVSQSGQSPDMLRAAVWAKKNGAETIALVNEPSSRLAGLTDHVVDVGAGAETSVAATKSFICSVAAGLQIAAAATRDTELRAALDGLPDVLEAATGLDWRRMLEPFAHVQSAYIVGRGPGLGIAQEMALKLKETCVQHAEAVSAAEIMHGPLQLLRAPMPVLVVGQNDESRASILAMLHRLSATNSTRFVAMEGYEGVGRLPVLAGLHPLIAPLACLQRFYGFAAELAVLRGHDPDRPELLRKVTETV